MTLYCIVLLSFVVVPKVLFTLFGFSDEEGVTIQALPYFASTREMIQEAPGKVRRYGINS